MVKLSFESTETWMYLWLKYVKNVNLNVHCAKSLIGDYSKKVDASAASFSIELDESNADYYYLCGVTKPYVWKNNFHLAFRKKEGESFDYAFNGTTVHVENAEKIDFDMEVIDWNNPYSKRKEYFTCRNWQFANWYKKNVCMQDSDNGDKKEDIDQLSLF